MKVYIRRGFAGCLRPGRFYAWGAPLSGWRNWQEQLRSMLMFQAWLAEQ